MTHVVSQLGIGSRQQGTGAQSVPMNLPPTPMVETNLASRLGRSVGKALCKLNENEALVLIVNGHMYSMVVTKLKHLTLADHWLKETHFKNFEYRVIPKNELNPDGQPD